MVTQALSDWLRVQLRERRESTREASLAAGLGDSTLRSIINRPRSRPDPETCERVARYFGVPLDYVLQLAGHPVTREDALTDPRLRFYTHVLDRMPAEDRELVLERLRPDIERQLRREEEARRGPA